MTGLEPATSGTTTRRSSQLSYTHRRRLTILPKTVRGRLARLKGFEPLTRSLEGCRSIQLSYRRPTSESSTVRATAYSATTAWCFTISAGSQGEGSPPRYWWNQSRWAA
jgi:hypothetical protein